MLTEGSALSLRDRAIAIAPKLDRIRALVVNRSADARAVISSILERDARIDVVATAKDSVVALRTALAQSPDLIVMDMDSACMSGADNAVSLKGSLTKTKIMVVCSEADRYWAGMADAVGADAFLLTNRLSAECESQLIRLFPA